MFLLSLVLGHPRIRLGLQQAGEMGRVGGEHSGEPGDIVGDLGKILEVGLVHRFADPIAGRLGGNGPAGVVERLKQLGRDVVRRMTILGDAGDGVAVTGRPAR